MATQSTDRSGREEASDETSAPTRARHVASTLSGRRRAESTAVLAGGALLARALRTRARSKRRAAAQALAGAALLGLALRRGSRDGAADGETGTATADTPAGETGDERATSGDEKEVSDDAHAALMRHAVVPENKDTPRGVADDADAKARTDGDEGEIRFTEGRDSDPHARPHLDDAEASDPRYRDDEGVEIDLSEASTTDSVSKAVGPDPEQAQPTMTEGTEPEPTPREDASHVEADVPLGTDAEDSDAGGDGSEAEEESNEAIVDDESETESDERGDGGDLAEDDEGGPTA